MAVLIEANPYFLFVQWLERVQALLGRGGGGERSREEGKRRNKGDDWAARVRRHVSLCSVNTQNLNLALLL